MRSGVRTPSGPLSPAAQKAQKRTQKAKNAQPRRLLVPLMSSFVLFVFLPRSRWAKRPAIIECLLVTPSSRDLSNPSMFGDIGRREAYRDRNGFRGANEMAL